MKLTILVFAKKSAKRQKRRTVWLKEKLLPETSTPEQQIDESTPEQQIDDDALEARKRDEELQRMREDFQKKFGTADSI